MTESTPIVAETRPEQILEVSARLFREQGFDAVSIRDLGTALGVSTSTLYHHFRSKNEILYAIMERFLHAFNDELLPIARSTASPRQRIVAVVQAHVVFQQRRLHEVLESGIHRRALHPDQRERVFKLLHDYRDAVRDVVAEGIETGEFLTADATLCAGMILDMLNGIWEWYINDGRLSIDELAARYADAALRLCEDRERLQMAVGR